MRPIDIRAELNAVLLVAFIGLYVGLLVQSCDPIETDEHEQLGIGASL